VSEENKNGKKDFNVLLDGQRRTSLAESEEERKFHILEKEVDLEHTAEAQQVLNT